MTRHVETAQSTAKVAADTGSRISELAVHSIVAPYLNIKRGPRRVLLLPQEAYEATVTQVDAASEEVPRGNAAIEIPAACDGRGRRLRLTNQGKVDVELLTSPGAGACR